MRGDFHFLLSGERIVCCGTGTRERAHTYESPAACYPSLCFVTPPHTHARTHARTHTHLPCAFLSALTIYFCRSLLRCACPAACLRMIQCGRQNAIYLALLAVGWEVAQKTAAAAGAAYSGGRAVLEKRHAAGACNGVVGFVRGACTCRKVILRNPPHQADIFWHAERGCHLLIYYRAFRPVTHDSHTAIAGHTRSVALSVRG